MVKVGLFGIGLETYWAQFDGLLGRLKSYQEWIKEKLSLADIEITDAGMVDSVQKAIETGEILNGKNVELVFLYIATYALSSTVLPVVRRIKVPVIILNLQPEAAIDYEKFNGLGDRGKMTGEWLAHCQACSVPEIASVFNRSGIPYEIITGYLAEKAVWDEISEWLSASRVLNIMKNNTLGVIGHYYNGMLDVYTDLTQQSIVFGSQIKLVEMCEILKFRNEVTENEVVSKISEFNSAFDVVDECGMDEIERAAKTSVALDKLVEKQNLGSIAYYYEGEEGNEYENIVTSIIAGNTLLTGRGVPVAGECEVKNAQAMKILDSFGAGGSFSEFYAMDFKDDIVLLGHDGPAHFKIAESKVKLVPLPLYHGKPGKGLSIQMKVATGPVTLLSVVQDSKGLFFLVAEGQSVEGPTLQIGNTNSRYKFPVGAREFINKWSKNGPAHHCAIGTGHIASKIEKLAFLLGVRFVKVC